MVKLSEGSGGKEMNALIDRMLSFIRTENSWKHSDNDGAVLKNQDGSFTVLTTDSYVLDPIFIPGGDIGKIAVCGTINDLAVMGATPIGLTLGIILEEGFDNNHLDQIMKSIGEVSKQTGVPIVTGDTKVVEKGKVDKIIINTSGIGTTNEILDKPIQPGDKILASGTIGDHAVAVLSKRFDFTTDTVTDSKPLLQEITSIKPLIKQAKDPTRGGLAATLNEICQKNNISIRLQEKDIPLSPQVKSVTELLGIDPYSLACEGRFICIVHPNHAEQALASLKTFNKDAAIIGEVTENPEKEVIVQTEFGKRILPVPSGNIVPRIC